MFDKQVIYNEKKTGIKNNFIIYLIVKYVFCHILVCISDD